MYSTLPCLLSDSREGYHADCILALGLQGITWEAMPAKLASMPPGVVVVFDSAEDIVGPADSRQVC